MSSVMSVIELAEQKSHLSNENKQQIEVAAFLSLKEITLEF